MLVQERPLHKPRTQRTLPYLKYYAVVNLLCVVNLLWHSDLLWRTPSRRHHFPWFCKELSSQKEGHTVVIMGGIVKTLRHSNSLSRSVFSTAGSFGNGMKRKVRRLKSIQCSVGVWKCLRGAFLQEPNPNTG